MECNRAWKFFISFLLTVLISQSLVTLVKCRSLEKEFANQKNYYTPDPTHARSPPRHHRTPACPPQSDSGSKCSCGPSHGGSPGTSTPPSHGGYYDNPPPSPTVEPITPSTPPLPPVIPVDPNTPPFNPGGSPPLIPVDPNSPPFYPGGSPPFIPVDPNTPPFNPGGSPPFIPVDPNTPPSTPGGSPPFIPVDPNTPPSTPGGIPGTSTYWSTNPTLIWGIFGYWATIGGLFGPATTLPFGTNLSVQEALANTRTDGFGVLYREGTASFLNSMVNKKFPFSTQEVKHAFASSLVSEKAAAEQAQIFKLANEGRLKKH